METEFAACLLVVGPPDYIGLGGTFYRDGDYPTSTQRYRDKCRRWYIKFLGLPCTQREFDDWWINYKKWYVENRRG